MLCYHWIFTLLSYFVVLFSSTLSFSITGDVILDLDSTTQTGFANDAALWSSDSSVSPLYTNCSGTWILGGYGVLSSTQHLSRTYSSLPTHTSAQVIINFWFIDVWTSINSISVDILDGGTVVFTRSLKVTTSNWPSNLCGDSSTHDLAPVTISSTVSHSGDFGLKIMCSAAANSPISGYCGLRDIRVTLSTTTTTSGTFCAYATDIANIDATTLSCTCPTGKYFNTSTGACETCDSACTACSGPTTSECSSCASGYTFDGVDTCYTCVTGCLVCTGGAPTDCLSCAPGNYYMYPNSSCLLDCSTPYTSNSSGYCNFHCTAPDYLFMGNFSCNPYCNDPYKKRQEGLELSCDAPCASNAYYYPNGSCSTSCDPPMVKATSDNMKFCDSPCSDSTMYYYPSDNTCHAGCSGTVTSETFYQSCTPSDSTGSGGSDDPQSKGTLQVLKETTDSVLNAGLIIASLASMGDSFSIIDGTMSRMFQYVRYLDIGYSAELEMVLISWSNGLFSVSFPSDPPNSLNDTAVYKPLPKVFSKYGLAPSFLYNYWQEWLMSVVFFGVFLCLVGLEYGVKRLKPKNPIFRTIAYYLRVMSAQFVLMVTYTSFGDMLFFAILEYRMTIPGRNISNLSLTISVIQLLVCIAILALQIKLTADKQRIIGNKSSRPNTEALKGFSKKYPGCQVFWHDFKDGSLSQQGFLLIFIGRTFLMMVILASLDTHPLVECVIIVIMNILMIMFLVWKRPFKERFNEIQQLFSEVCLLFVNISCLSMAALDAQDREASTTRTNLGYFIIILNTIFNFASLVFLVFMGYVIGKHFYHERKEAKLKRSQTKAQSAAQQDQNEQLSLASAEQDASSAVRLKRKTTRLDLTETFDKTKKESKYPETSQDLNLHISLEGPTMLTRGKSFVDLCMEDGKDTEREFQTSGAASAYRTHKSRTLRANQIKQDLKKGSPEPGKESMRSLMNTWKESLVSAETDRSPSPEIRRTQTLAEKLESTTRSKYTDPEPSPFEYVRPLLQHSNTTEVLVKESKTEESPTRMNDRPKSRPIQLAKQTIVAYVSPTHVNKGTISVVNIKEVPKESVLNYGSMKPKVISSEKEQSLAMASELEKKLTLKSQESIKAKKERSLVNESNNSQNLSQSSSQNLGQLSKKSTSKFDKLDNDDVTTTKPNSK